MYIVSSVTYISDYAFASCKKLQDIVIPNGVTYIGDGVFSGCATLKYNEYDNALYLGNSENPYLVLVKAKTKQITSCTIHRNTKFICSAAFYECKALTGVAIPDGVISIGASAFSSCMAMTRVVIPSSVVSIGGSAFKSCQKLAEIIFNGSKAQWDSIKKGKSWNQNIGAFATVKPTIIFTEESQA